MSSATTPRSEEPAGTDRWVAGATHSAAERPGHPIVQSHRVEHIDDETTMIAMDMLVCVPVNPDADNPTE